jgi:hypothetical protein
MKILALDVTNVKRVRAVHIEPTGATVILGGRNAQGKSSVLDSITMALAGGKHIPGVPVHRGEKRGEVRLDLGEVVITRTFTEGGGGSLTVEANVGGTVARVQSPQAWLDHRIGALSFDPLEFMRQKPGPQAETMRRLVGVDTTALDAERVSTFAQRTDLNRQVRDAEGAFRDMPQFPDAPAEPIAAEALTAELDAARAVNATREQALQSAREDARHAVECATKMEQAQTLGELAVNRGREEKAAVEAGIIRDRSALQREVERNQAEVTRLEALLREARAIVEEAAGALLGFENEAEVRRVAAREKAADAETKADEAYRAALALAGDADRKAREARAAAEALPVADEAAVIAKFSEAESINQQIAANRARAEAERRADAIRERARVLTDRIDAIDTEKARLLSAAQFPVPGLSFGADGGVTLDGLPLDQASGAEQIRVSMAVALALNPTLRVVLIRDASLLDTDSLRLVAEMAAERDAQVWLERVGDGDVGAVVIEDGCVREDVSSGPAEGVPE